MDYKMVVSGHSPWTTSQNEKVPGQGVDSLWTVHGQKKRIWVKIPLTYIPYYFSFLSMDCPGTGLSADSPED